MKYLVLLYLFIPIWLIAQNEDPFPTKIKENSEFNIQSSEKGFDLVAFSTAPCGRMGRILDHIQERVSFIKESNDSLFIGLTVKAICCTSFKGEIEILENDTINFKFEEYGRSCACDCCYGLNYIIKLDTDKITSANWKFKLNDKPIKFSYEECYTYPEQYEIYLGDTINYTDRYGLAQGYWLKKDSLNRITLEGLYENTPENFMYNVSRYLGFKGRIVFAYHGISNQVKRELIIVENYYHYYIERVYDKEGNIIKECLITRNREIAVECKEY